MKKSKTPEVENNVVEVAEVVPDKKYIVNCPKCSTSLFVKVGNFAHLCPVCSKVFRTRMAERLVKSVTRQKVVEAYITVDKDEEGQIQSDSIVNEIED